MKRRAVRGLTIIELLITVAVLGILTAIVAPSFSDAFLSNRLASYSNTFLASTQLARSEAIKRNTNVVLCRTSDGAACTSSGDWRQGWMAFADTDNDGTLDSGETRVLYEASLSTDYSLAPTSTVTNLRFAGTGMLASPTTSTDLVFELKRTNPEGSQYRELRIGPTGRAKIRTCRNGTCS